jgi:hypothetical protein
MNLLQHIAAERRKTLAIRAEEKAVRASIEAAKLRAAKAAE